MEIGIGDEDFDPRCIRQRIARFFSLDNPEALYWYDFGDDWYHKITLEKIVPADPKITYPCCLAGKRACPPEDSGGVWGFYEKLEILRDPKHEDYEEVLDWMDPNYYPEHFDHKEVVFDDPKTREKSLSVLY